MFKDAEEELARLNRQLLEEDEEELNEEEYEEEESDEETEYDTYNTDNTDVDLEEYSQQVYEQPPSRKGIVAAILFATAVVLLFLAYLLAKRGGLL